MTKSLTFFMVFIYCKYVVALYKFSFYCLNCHYRHHQHHQIIDWFLFPELGDVMEALQEEKKGEHIKSGSQVKKTATHPKIEETLAALMTKLAEKRKSASRPDDITVGFHG